MHKINLCGKHKHICLINGANPFCVGLPKANDASTTIGAVAGIFVLANLPMKVLSLKFP